MSAAGASANIGAVPSNQANQGGIANTISSFKDGAFKKIEDFVNNHPFAASALAIGAGAVMTYLAFQGSIHAPSTTFSYTNLMSLGMGTGLVAVGFFGLHHVLSKKYGHKQWFKTVDKIIKVAALAILGAGTVGTIGWMLSKGTSSALFYAGLIGAPFVLVAGAAILHRCRGQNRVFAKSRQRPAQQAALQNPRPAPNSPPVQQALPAPDPQQPQPASVHSSPVHRRRSRSPVRSASSSPSTSPQRVASGSAVNPSNTQANP